MQRQLSRIATLLLCSASLAACSTFSGSGAAKADSASDQVQTADAGQQGLPTDLEGEIHRAQQLRADGNLTEAIKALGQLVLVAPDDARVVGEYGKTLTQLDRSQEAIQFLTRAVQLAPNDATFYSALGVAYDQTGDSADAKAAYERALALKPGDAVVLNNYALSRMLAGDTPAAKKLIAEAAAADGSDAKIARNVAYVNQAAAPAVKDAAPVAQLPSKPVAGNSAPAVAAAAPAHAGATGAPQQLNPNVMMQHVPADPLAGPVGGHRVAAKAAGKPVAQKKAPPLRMSADAS